MNTVIDNGRTRDAKNEEPIAVTDRITTCYTTVSTRIPDGEDIIDDFNVPDNPYHDVNNVGTPDVVSNDEGTCTID